MSKSLPQLHGDLVPIGLVVAEISTEYPRVTHSSLRFLEREGLLEPLRTTGGHRLYSRSDIERIRLIKRWQTQRLTLEEIRHRLNAREENSDVARLSTHFLDLVISGDLIHARQVMTTADSQGVPLLSLLGDVLAPAMLQIGERWERGELTVSEEKEVTELARDLISTLFARHQLPPPVGPPVVAGSVAGELHDLGMRMVSGCLRMRGYPVRFLGADISPEFLIEAVHRIRPNAILLSATMESHLASVTAVMRQLQLTGGPVPLVIVGGTLAATHGVELKSQEVIPIARNYLADVVEDVSRLLPRS